MTNTLFDIFPPRPKRSHEIFGPGSDVFAAIVCGLSNRPVIWLSEKYKSETLNPNGFAEFCDPKNLLIAKTGNQTDTLASAEESLRSGAVAVVVAELSKPLSLTAGRRLQLAAQAGKSTGLFIISEDMGSNAAETRWHCRPVDDDQDSTLQRWDLIKNKKGTLGNWNVLWNAEKRRVIVVSNSRE